MPSNSADKSVEDTATETAKTDTAKTETAKTDLNKTDVTTDSKPTGKAAKKKVAGAQTAAAAATTTDAEPAVSKPAPESDGSISLTVSKSLLKKIAAGVVVVALLALIGVGVWQWVAKSRELAAFDDAKAASNTFVTALVSTSNADNAGNYKDILGPLSTGDLRSRLEKERTDTEKNVADLKLKVTSKILVSSVESFDAAAAKTLVMAEVTGTSAQLPTGATNLMVFRLDLKKVDDKWLVSRFDGPPGSRNGQIDPSQSLPGATTTPAPASTPAPAG